MSNTPRLPKAAEVLRDEVLALKPRAKVEPYGDLDGFQVWRSLVFSKSASTWLDQMLAIIEDKRIEDTETLDDGRLVVTFVGTIDADLSTTFALRTVSEILQES